MLNGVVKSEGRPLAIMPPGLPLLSKAGGAEQEVGYESGVNKGGDGRGSNRELG